MRGIRVPQGLVFDSQWFIPARAGKTYWTAVPACGNSAHPRAGGENLSHGLPRIPIRRLIPARAGKTVGVSSECEAGEAHPRAGGENRAAFHRFERWFGSSPRGRGKHQLTNDDDGRTRLIPARAGKTPRHRTGRPRTAAHPRAGGENSTASASLWRLLGSSPRGRGKHRRRRQGRRRERLIPARAGKTGPTSRVAAAKRAHPRAGGENPVLVAPLHAGRGSSPRGRGKRHPRPDRVPPDRLIPTRAGKTTCIASRASPHTAHPRAGGENYHHPRAAAYTSGSSPRGRGKLQGGLTVLGGQRLIPARAGKTCPRWSAPTTRRAHPRAGGENRLPANADDYQVGSSPRGRGKRSTPLGVA